MSNKAIMRPISKLPAPYNLTIRKGSVNVALKRDYANSIVNDRIVLELYNYMYDMSVPEESFFSTLITLEKLEDGTLIQDLTKDTTHGVVRQSLFIIFLELSLNV
jgi:hypothetical protein